ncbi:MAG TPA: hypothetical protein VN937_05125 [Blastocatellia bacterium]|nr:hypothetical protein [Blastocatellia bacterium]
MLRSDEKARFTKSVVTSTAIVTILIFSVFAIGAARQDVQRSSKLVPADGEKEIVKRVKQYPDAPISLQNRERCPILIQEANVKEITSDEYYQLTRMKTDSNLYVSFPKVKLINKTDMRLTGFALFLTNSRTGRTNFLKRSRITVEPNSDYSVVFNEWVVPEKLTQVTENGKTVNIKQRLNLDSEKMWLEGTARDLVLEIVEVTLEDGSTWSRNSASLGSLPMPNTTEADGTFKGPATVLRQRARRQIGSFR